MIEIQDVTYGYGSSLQPVLNGVTLRFGEGQYIGLIGPNGCGKTTLARHLNGLITPTSGSVLVDGMDTRRRQNLAEIRRRVGMIFQNPENQIVGVTVEEDVAFGPGNLRLLPSDIRARVSSALATAGLTGYEGRHPQALSGGEKQLLALAGILSMMPRYVILDEPTASLDPVSKNKVLSILTALNKSGIGIIHITHGMDEVTSADRIVVMSKGRVAADGTPSDIFRRIGWLKSLGLAPPLVSELMCRLDETWGDNGATVFTVEDAMSRILSIAKAPVVFPSDHTKGG
jgi:biotin transport system ATP-binding protein/energy-coupling factor transport system ATP-binding protein